MWVYVCVCVSADNVYVRVCRPPTVRARVGRSVCVNAGVRKPRTVRVGVGVCVCLCECW